MFEVSQVKTEGIDELELEDEVCELLTVDADVEVREEDCEEAVELEVIELDSCVDIEELELVNADDED